MLSGTLDVRVVRTFSLPIAVDASRWAEDAAARVRKNKGLTLPKREHTEGSYGDTPEHSTHVHDRVQHRGRLVADKPGAAAPLAWSVHNSWKLGGRAGNPLNR
jgi:hypothetical protein